MEHDERTQILAAQQGNRALFDQLIRKHDTSILQILSGLLDNPCDIQDVYQETFLRAYQNISKFRFQSAFKTWLIRIAINQAVNWRKRKRLRSLWFSSISPADEVFQIPSHEHSPEDHLIADELQQQLRQQLDQLSTPQRTIFVLKHVQGYKIREIAEIMNCAQGTVKIHLFRATAKLRQRLVSYQPNQTQSGSVL